MFRLLNIEFKGHPQLGDVNLPLADEEEIHKSSKPYTSLVIGANGTGKSFLLRTIAEIFRQIHKSVRLEKPDFTFSYSAKLKYYCDGDYYTVLLDKARGHNKTVAFAKNDIDISLRELRYPERIIVNSVMLNDRFVWHNSQPQEFYQYLGIRSTSRSSNTQSSSRKTVTHLFNARSSNYEFIKKLHDLLEFLDYEKSFNVNYKTKINKLFFSGNLTKEKFKQYYEYWWDDEFTYTKRKQENPIWSKPYYDNNFKEYPEKVEEIVAFMNELTLNNNRIHKIPRSDAKMISIDLLANDFSDKELQLIRDLESLDIINLNGIRATKRNTSLSISQMSSGEYHLLISLIGIFANIRNNTLVLIDEPEISLHPNWQMKYIAFLKNVFHEYSSCQFILTSHSHFIVSDLEGDSSSLTGLKRNSNGIIETLGLDKDLNTYGWSAEEVLYQIFNVRTSRNSYLEFDLIKLITLINRGSQDIEEIKRIYDKISSLVLNDADPLNIIKEKTEKYINKNA